MADIRPFRALRYDLPKAGDIQELTCPLMTSSAPTSAGNTFPATATTSSAWSFPRGTTPMGTPPAPWPSGARRASSSWTWNPGCTCMKRSSSPRWTGGKPGKSGAWCAVCGSPTLPKGWCSPTRKPSPRPRRTASSCSVPPGAISAPSTACTRTRATPPPSGWKTSPRPARPGTSFPTAW